MTPVAARILTASATFVVLGETALGVVAREIGALNSPRWEVVFSLAGLVCVTGGWIVFRHDHSSPVAPALAWTSGAISLTVGIETVAASSFTDSPLPLADVIAPVWNGVWTLQLAGVTALLIVFPDGKPAGWFWRCLPALGVAGAVMVCGGMWGTVRNADGRATQPVGDVPAALASLGSICVGVTLLSAIVCVVIGYRRGAERRRAQTRWLILAGMVVLVLLVGGWFAESAGATLNVAYTPFIAAIVTLVPLAVTVAVVSHDLYDIDRLLSATTAWIVTIFLSALAYAGVVLAVSRFVTDRSGVQSFAAAFATAIVLLPLHRFVNEAVGRFVDRDRWVAVTAIQRFAADVRVGRREPEEVEAVLRSAQGDPGLAILLAAPHGRWVDLEGVAVESRTARAGFLLENHGDVVARIELTRGSARDVRRAKDMAQVAWVAIEVSRLRLGLREALGDARASRERLVEASDAERRRLERDLHDGAQQQIVAVGMRLRSVQRDLPAGASEEIDVAVRELEETVGDLRRLASGVRPSRLGDGLGAALEGLRESSPMPFGLAVADLPPLDETRAMTGYLVVTEALANSFKHARSTRVDVRVSAEGERLVLEISDDGIGGVEDEMTLTALRDRVLAVGGELHVASPRGHGTTIRAVV